MKLLAQVLIPHESVNDEEVTIISLYFKDGDLVKKDDIVIEVETSKAIITLNAEEEGYIFYNCKSEDEVPVGSSVADIYDEKKPIERLKIKEEKSISKEKTIIPTIKTVFSKKAKQLIEQHNIDAEIFEDKDFVGAEEVEAYLNKSKKNNGTNPPVNVASLPVADYSALHKEINTSAPKFENNTERIIIVCPATPAIEVIWDIMQGQNKEIVGYVVDDKYKGDLNLPSLDCNVFDFAQKIDKKIYDTVVIAMGGSLRSMRFRKKIFDHYIIEGIQFTNLISNRANIGNNVSIGVGNIIGSGVFIGTGTSVGHNNFISYMTVIGHHNTVGNNNLFAPGVMMSGMVEIGDDCILTTGVNFIDHVKVGNRVILPLGYNVVSDLADDTTVKMRIS